MNKSPKEIMIELKDKFNGNFNKCIDLKDDDLQVIFIYLQVISNIGQALKKNSTLKHHSECCLIFDELFADTVSALYLSSCAIDKPALIILRRVLELGLTAVYLWDMPHMAYAWKKYDQDLSFSEMLKHINSEGYLSYVSEETNTQIKTDLFPTDKCQKIYGNLSNIVHGKMYSFESSLPDKFSFVEEEWHSFTVLTESVLKILINGYISRYSLKNIIVQKCPQSKMVLE
jgi:hypothetical protein